MTGKLTALHDIEHRTTKIRSPRSNGFVERMNRTLLDEHFHIKDREKWYESVEEILADLDVFVAFYNLKRSHQGYRLKGRTPAQALREALDRKKLPPIIQKEDEYAVAEAAQSGSPEIPTVGLILNLYNKSATCRADSTSTTGTTATVASTVRHP